MESEKPVKLRVKYRKAAAITFVSSIVAFVLSLIALLSTSEQGTLKTFDIVTLNTSTLLQNAIKVESASPTTTAQAKRSAQLPDIDLPDIDLPGTSQIVSVISVIASDVSTAILPGATATAAPGSSGGDLSSDLESLLGSIVGDLTGAASDTVLDVVDGLIGQVVSAIGIKQWYSLYPTEYCEGDYTPSYSAPDAKQQVSSCKKITDSSILNVNQTPSTLQIGQTVLDFSALNIPNKLSQTGGTIKSLLTAIFALQIIGIVCSGLLIVLTPPYLFLGFVRRRPVRFLLAGLTGLAFNSLLVVASIMTGIVVIAAGAVNQLAGGLGIEAESGGSALALLWVGTVLMGISTIAWVLQWHSATFSRRREGEPI